MDVKKSNNNYYPVKMEELPIYELERKKIEDKLDVLDYKLKEQHKKLEEIEHKIFCCNFNYYFTQSLK